jgi:hypothetical protein
VTITTPTPKVTLRTSDPEAVISRLFDAITATPALTLAALILLGHGTLGAPDVTDLQIAEETLAADAAVRDALAIQVRAEAVR